MTMVAHAAATRRVLAFALLCACLAHAGCAGPITHGDANLPNFQQVSDTLYRGGQPTRDGFSHLKEIGVKTIVNAREGDTDSQAMSGLIFDYQQRPMQASDIDDADVVWFLKIVANPARAPVFVHCHRGSDRTGCLVAMYRVVVQNWDRERAIAEMTAEGNGFHDLVFHNLVEYVRTADVERLRRQAGLGEEVASSAR